MPKAKVIMINPNPRSMSLIAPVVSLFYGLLKRADIDMVYFDTALYNVTSDYNDTDQIKQDNLAVKPVAMREGVNLRARGDRNQMFKDFRTLCETYQPDVLVVSAYEMTVTFAREIVRSVSDLKIPAALGGHFATYASDLAITFDEFEAICVGEGEEVLASLVLRLKNRESLRGLPNIWYRDSAGSVHKTRLSPPTDTTDNPPFDITPFDESRLYRPMNGRLYRMFPVETFRGCPMKCTFCNSPLQDETYKRETGQRYYRGRNMDNVFADIDYFVNKCGAEYLFFWADNFLAMSRQLVDEFAERYEDYKHVPFWIQSYPTVIDRTKIERLKKVGLRRMAMGVEHGNETFRREVIHRAYKNDRAIENVKVLNELGIESTGNYIVGFPDETPELHWDTVMLNRALNTDSASISIFTPFFGTPLRDVSIKKGYLKNPLALAPSNDEESILEMPQFPPDVIRGKQRTFNIYAKLPESRWNAVRQAEQLTPEGDRIFADLKAEVLDKERARRDFYQIG